MTAVHPAQLSTPTERLAILARAIEPILNRVVLAGPSAIAFLINDGAIRVPELTFAADSTLRLLTTSMIDRIGLDLQKLGLSRIGHTADSNRWRVTDDVMFELVQVRSDDADPEHVWLEYATLLTLPCNAGNNLVVRMAGAPSILALECFAFDKRGGRVVDSEELERVVWLAAGRREIERECATAPPELRAFIAASLGRVAHTDAFLSLIQRALPDAPMLAALARRVRERLLRMAGVAASHPPL